MTQMEQIFEEGKQRALKRAAQLFEEEKQQALTQLAQNFEERKQQALTQLAYNFEEEKWQVLTQAAQNFEGEKQQVLKDNARQIVSLMIKKDYPTEEIISVVPSYSRNDVEALRIELSKNDKTLLSE